MEGVIPAGGFDRDKETTMRRSRMVLSAALLAIAFGALAACMQDPNSEIYKMDNRTDGHGLCCDYGR